MVTAPNISVSPSGFSFGNIPLTVASSPQTFTFSNTGSQNLVVSSIVITGPDSGMFSLQTDTCPGLSPTLAPGANCTVTVVFTPSSEGVKNATLQILSNDPDTPAVKIALSGTGAVVIPDFPDLTGPWDPKSQTCKEKKEGMKCKVKGKLRITNTGTENALNSVVRYYLSADAVYDATDVELKRVDTGTVKTGKTKSKTFSYSFEIGSSASCQYVIAVIDSDSVLKCAEMSGACQAVLDITSSYAKERIQFDRPIGSFQAIQHKLADMLIDVEAVQYLLYQAARGVSVASPSPWQISAAKAKANEAYQRICIEAITSHGAIRIQHGP